MPELEVERRVVVAAAAAAAVSWKKEDACVPFGQGKATTIRKPDGRIPSHYSMPVLILGFEILYRAAVPSDGLVA